MRSGDFFKCPICGARDYYAGVCCVCWEMYYEEDEVVVREIKDYNRYKKGINRRKKNIIEAVKEGVPLPRSVKDICYVTDPVHVVRHPSMQ